MKDNRTYVKMLLARAMYHKRCEFKKVDPFKFPYTDPGSLDYAAIAIDLLGYDDDGITELELYLRDKGDDV